MNVVHSGDTFQIYGESLKTYGRLPIRTYDVGFHKMMGFFLTAHPDLTVLEEKVYGSHEKKVDKVLNSFKVSNRNFGVLLSGQKGIGKSLFARVLACKAIAAGYPLILVSGYIPGIADFLSSIDQEVVVLFDEFEKTFASSDDGNPQDEMLSLFDGIDGGKKLFVITCNETNKLSTYLLNRPGRFHYHFALTNPSPNEVEEYMKDKLEEQYWESIDKIINFSCCVEVTYDCLRAIAFELNQGYSLEETLADLNISKEQTPYYDIVVTFEDGEVARTESRIDIYKDGLTYFWYTMPGYSCSVRLDFNGTDVILDKKSKTLNLDPRKTKTYVDTDYFDDDNEKEQQELHYMKTRPIQSIKFYRKPTYIYSKYSL